jgi:Glycosyl transferases group 1
VSHTNEDPTTPGTLVVLSHFAAHLELDLAWAFRALGWEVAVWGYDNERAFNAAISDTQLPALVLYPNTGGPLFPSLVKCRLPTVGMMHDTHRYPSARILTAQLFDVMCVRDPGVRFDAFRLGHRRAQLLPHGVVKQDFVELSLERDLDVGWIGTSQAPIYRRRRQLLPILDREFVMNDWRRRYPPALIPHVYGRSKIVVNLSRDDWPADANTRVFEAMAAGALLLTSLPTDLTALGFVDGLHFIGYENEADLIELVRRWLEDDSGRAEIATAGRAKVLSEFTYEAYARSLATIIIEEGEALIARRRLSESDAAAIILEVYLKERRWSVLPGRLPALIGSAGAGVAPVMWRGLASSARHALHVPRSGDLKMALRSRREPADVS